MQAVRVYETEPCVRTFRQDLELHLLTGYVFSTPEYFIMGRPVNRYAAHSLIIDPLVCFPKEEWNCWHIYVMSGNIALCWDREPLKLPFVSWEKRNKLKIYPMNAIRTRINRHELN